MRTPVRAIPPPRAPCSCSCSALLLRPRSYIHPTTRPDPGDTSLRAPSIAYAPPGPVPATVGCDAAIQPPPSEAGRRGASTPSVQQLLHPCRLVRATYASAPPLRSPSVAPPPADLSSARCHRRMSTCPRATRRSPSGRHPPPPSHACDRTRRDRDGADVLQPARYPFISSVADLGRCGGRVGRCTPSSAGSPPGQRSSAFWNRLAGHAGRAGAPPPPRKSPPPPARPPAPPRPDRASLRAACPCSTGLAGSPALSRCSPPDPPPRPRVSARRFPALPGAGGSAAPEPVRLRVPPCVRGRYGE